ncbi:tetratricopeptide repeat protein [Xanthocytophaga agilis]|uniref:Tetratricopeptide repeat protein n=1 Tax=Xanthocytophaga agilis TaxID=3048010 RepID=A0AAE3R364_9BACT|nr:tetratricopeptide repeat protein [Xanthocytophaga agilis]MDJ1500530.1 tetratricopeptide repeat protein [Xanthocytophaga agilis]
MENTELIERYFEGKLSPHERKEFETRVAQETSFSEEVALQRTIREGLRAVGRGRMLSKLEEVESNMSAYHPPTQVIRFDERTRQRFYWAAAAAIVLLIPVYLLLKANVSHDALFARYFTPYENTATQSANQDPLNHALQLYRAKNYAQALGILETLEDKGNASDSALFYKANVHMQLEQPTEAITTLKQISSTSTFYDEAQWYLALAYFQNKETNKAKELLTNIAQTPAHPYHQQAQELSKELK